MSSELQTLHTTEFHKFLLAEFEKNLPQIYAANPKICDKKSLTQETKQAESAAAQAHLYPLIAGGKRIRPLFCLLIAAAMGGEKGLKMAWPAALALECIHTYSLVHDDLPCMDNDDFRRGKPTTHKIYGEAQGLLVGDGLLTQAFQILAESPLPAELKCQLISMLSRASGASGMILGQWLDLHFTANAQINEFTKATWSDLERIHCLKTGELLSASWQMGMLIGLESGGLKREELVLKAKVTGMNLGLVFQLVDDILDATASSETLGKTAGKDESQNKLTAVRLLGIEKTKQLVDKMTAEIQNHLCAISDEIHNSVFAKTAWHLLSQTVDALSSRKN